MQTSRGKIKYCGKGHRLFGDNLYINHRIATQYANSAKGTYDEKVCKECHRQHQAAYYARQQKLKAIYKNRNMAELTKQEVKERITTLQQLNKKHD